MSLHTPHMLSWVSPHLQEHLWLFNLRLSLLFSNSSFLPRIPAATGGQREKDPAVALQDLLQKRGEIPQCVRVSGAGGKRIMSQQSRRRARADGFG